MVPGVRKRIFILKYLVDISSPGFECETPQNPEESFKGLFITWLELDLRLSRAGSFSYSSDDSRDDCQGWTK